MGFESRSALQESPGSAQVGACDSRAILRDVTGDDRRRRAIVAAVEVARGYGLQVSDPLVLKDSNNTVVWLRPLPVVAKVGTNPLALATGLELERDVLAYLGGTDVPVAHLATGLPPELHRAADHSVLLLNYVEHDPAAAIAPTTARAALESVHDALRSYRGELPAFTERLTRIRALVTDPIMSPGLADDDRMLLIGVADEFAASFRPDPAWRPLHGDPWMGGNLLSTPKGAVLVDFEAACRGPVEWDWSSLPSDVAPPGLDRDVAARLRLLRSVTVAAWCFAQPGRAPEVDSAGRYHLSVIHAVARHR